MGGAGLTVENSKGECNLGQHEVNFRYETALLSADNHAIYKNGAKEIAAQEEMSITFMAKFNEREGNSCHIHCSLANADGGNAFAADQALFESFVAGQIACMRELTLLYAPHVNSYKRFALGSFAPTAIAWGKDNRTCSLRVVGHGEGLRVENRLPGADVNPYLALSALIAAGLHGIDNELPLEPAFEGNAYASDKPRVPHNIYDARDAFAASEVAADAFGGEVVEHYLNRAKVEIDAFEAAVTDWERFRGFERLYGVRVCVERPGGRDLRRGRAGVLGSLGRLRGGVGAAQLRAGAAAGGGDRADPAARQVAVDDPDVLLDRVDALLLAGGADIDPASYGDEPHPETKGTWPERDAFELALTRRALERDMPVLGICRGMQLINVAMGGTLDQHLPESIGDGRHRSIAGTFGTHHVRLAEGTLACGAAGHRRPRW